MWEPAHFTIVLHRSTLPRHAGQWYVEYDRKDSLGELPFNGLSLYARQYSECGLIWFAPASA
jgi:hypothetical protein